MNNPAPFASQVLLSRFLFREGERALELGGAMRAGLAVSLFQDATELMIWTVAKSLDASLKDQAPFDSFWDAIPKAPKNSQQLELPSRTAMRELNKARVNFKHYGQMPTVEDANRFRGATDAFLRESAERFFRVELDSYSLADLVANEQARAKIKEAEALLSKERWQDCVDACAIAEYVVAKEFETIIPEPDDSLNYLASHLEDRGIEFAGSALRHLRNYLSILRSVGIQSLTGRNLRHYAHFLTLAPTVTQYSDGHMRCEHIPRMKGKLLSREDAEFCINYVTEFAIQAQK